MNWLLEIVPFPILIGMFIWSLSMCLFSVFILIIVILFYKRSFPIVELVSVKKDLSNLGTIQENAFSCDSLSLISIEKTANDNDKTINSFYLRNSYCLKENEKNYSFPSIKISSNQLENKQINTLPQLSTRRSIIPDLTSISNSFYDKKTHQSIDSLFSKDSLCE